MDQVVAVFGVILMLGLAVGSRDEGPAERACRQIDQAVERVREGTEGSLERLGREVDEAVKATRETAKEVEEATR